MDVIGLVLGVSYSTVAVIESALNYVAH